MLHNLFNIPNRNVIQKASATARRRLAKQPPRQRRSLLLETLEDRRLLATVTWSNSVGGDWAVAGNWDLNRLPTSGDDVTIPDLVGTPTITTAGTVAVRSLVSNETIAVTGGSLSVVSPAVLNGGLIESGGKFYSGSGMTNTSSVTVGQNATMVVSATPTNGLLGQWRLEGNTLDSAGSHNAFNSNAVNYVSGLTGTAVKLGSGGFIDIADSTDLRVQQVTLSASLL